MSERVRAAETQESMECPACGGKCRRHEADIGVGIQYGPWFCEDCVWQEMPPDYGLIEDDAGDFQP